jgi:hypothetical protein
MAEGVDGLTRDKTREPGKQPTVDRTAERVEHVNRTTGGAALSMMPVNDAKSAVKRHSAFGGNLKKRVRRPSRCYVPDVQTGILGRLPDFAKIDFYLTAVRAWGPTVLVESYYRTREGPQGRRKVD